MKFVRPLLITLVLLLVIGAAILGVALLPGVQRWAVLRAARDVPGLKFDVTEVSAGFSGITLQGVSAEKQQVKVNLARLEADFSLFQLLTSRQLSISQLKVTGLVVDASRVSHAKAEAAAVGAPAAAPGLLGQVELPVELRLDDVHIEGRALLPGTGSQPPVETEFTVTGGKFAPGQEGVLQLNATLRNPAPAAPVTILRAHAGLRATLTPQRIFNNVILTTVVDAEGPGLSGQSQLKVSAELFRSTAGENYVIGVDTITHGATENMLKVTARLGSASRQYEGKWTLNARTQQLEPFFLGGAMPDYDFNGGGDFSVDPASMIFNLKGGLKGKISRLEAIEPAWRAFGPVTIDTVFDLGQLDGILKINQFKAVLAGAKPVLDINTTTAIRYDLTKGKLITDGLTSDKLLQMNLQGVPLDWVRPFVPVVDISGGMITGQIDLFQAGSVPSVRGGVQVAGLNVVREGRPLVTGATIALRTEASLADGVIRAPLLELTVSTPEGDSFKLTGNASTQTGPDAPVSLTGKFEASTAKLLARWFPGAPVSAQGEIDFTLRGSTLEFQPGRLSIQQGAGKPLVSAVLLQPFSLNLDNHALAPADAAQPVARIELGRLPLGLLPLTEPDTTLGGFVQQGDFDVSVREGKIILRATAPLKLADISLTQGRQKALVGLSLEATPTVEYAGPNDLKIVSGDMTVRAGARGTLATLKAEVVQSPGQGSKATMTFNLEIPALATQPLFAGVQAVSAGRATGEVRAAIGAQTHLEARMTLNGLIGAESKQTFPVANLSFRGVVNQNGTVSLQVPLLLDNAGRRTDLNVAVELSPLGNGYSVDGRLTGQLVELEDVMTVLSVFLASAAPDSGNKPPAAVSVAPDTVSAWSRYSGQLGLDIRSVVRGQEWAMTGLTGTLAIEPARLAVQKLSAAFSETSRLTATAEMRFTGGAMPYRLTGEYALNDFDAGKLFKALEPGKPPTVEGLFTVNSKFAGNGETPARALDRLHGEFQLTSRQGIFRGLQRASNKLSMTSKAVELGASVLGSIFGSEKATKTAEKVAGQTYFVDQLAQSLGEFNYDLLSVKLSRDERLNMNLQDISLVSPEIRFNGRGEVAYVVGKPLLEQPLTASLTFAARGKVEQQLGKLRLLDGTKDDLGYSRTKETITLGGTLTKPDPTAFFTKIATAKLSEFLDSEN